MAERAVPRISSPSHQANVALRDLGSAPAAFALAGLSEDKRNRR